MNICNNRKKWHVSLFLIIFLVTLSTMGCKMMAHQQSDVEEPAKTVKVADVRRQDFTVTLEANGVIATREKVDVVAKAASVVKEIRKHKGAKVMMGEVIILLDNSKALAELGKAENNLAVLDNSYLQAVSDKVFLMERRDDARNNFERMELLYQQGTISYYELENARAEVNKLENAILSINLNAMQDAVNRARLTVEEARAKLSATVVTSPMEGIITEMAVKNGQAVSEGKSYFSVGENALPEAILSIPVQEAVRMQNGLEVSVFCEQYSEKHYKGQVSHFSAADLEVNPEAENALVNLRITMTEEAAELPAGAKVNANIILEQKQQVLTVPTEAVVEVDGKSVVFIYDDGLARMREVECGSAGDSVLEIISGVKEKEQVIISPSAEIKDGVKVQKEDE
ncbi:MAG: efflux RND transporter periplasmic adaptor subunit [Peptococcia bacterium]